MSDTLFHINWGDGDDSFIIAPDRRTAIRRMPEGKNMVNYVVKLDALYQMIYKAGQGEVVEWADKYCEERSAKWGLTKTFVYINMEDWQAYKEEIGEQQVML